MTTFVRFMVKSYTKNMSILTKATSANQPKTADSQKIIYFYALILIIFLLCQLFSYEDFVLLIESFWLPGGDPFARFLSSLIVASELFALPFLLRMKLSSLMRVISMVLSWIVPIVWISLSLWVNLTTNAISNMGFLGSVVRITPGVYTVLISIALAILSIWSSWALWPILNKPNKKK